MADESDECAEAHRAVVNEAADASSPSGLPSLSQAEIIQALNDRDAYGLVVARLIEWFLNPNSEEFEHEDFQAIMIDAGLMDREDYYLLDRANALFALSTRIALDSREHNEMPERANG